MQKGVPDLWSYPLSDSLDRVGSGLVRPRTRASRLQIHNTKPFQCTALDSQSAALTVQPSALDSQSSAGLRKTSNQTVTRAPLLYLQQKNLLTIPCTANRKDLSESTTLSTSSASRKNAMLPACILREKSSLPSSQWDRGILRKAFELRLGPRPRCSQCLNGRSGVIFLRHRA